MGTSIFIAKILGPFLLVAALGIISNQKFYQKVMEDYSKNAAVFKKVKAFYDHII